MIHALIPEEVNALGLLLLAFAGVVLPILIVKSARRLGTGRLPIAGILIPRWFEATVSEPLAVG